VSAAGETISVPLNALVPLQPFEPVQESASELIHVSVLKSPSVISAGEAVNDTVGKGSGGGVTVTVTDSSTLSPFPVQVSV